VEQRQGNGRTNGQGFNRLDVQLADCNSGARQGKRQGKSRSDDTYVAYATYGGVTGSREGTK
jgi:hypothetical protein